MAQNFRNDLERNVGTSGSPATLVTASDFDAVIGIRCCNTSAATISASVTIVNGGNDHFLAKDVNIPPNSAIELIQGGAKIVLKNGDVLKAYASTGSALDIVTSFISQISS
mgnify:FL=1|jgi:hypothetical protein